MMKKLLPPALLALALALSLAACGNNSADNAETTQSANVPTAGNGDSGALETDFQKDMNQSTSLYIRSICETEDGWYFEYDGMVYFMDRETGNTTVLCGKPECSHNYAESADCNAFIHSDFLTCYNGKLYYNNSDYVQENGTYVNKGERLYSMELDGTSHDAVQQLDLVVGGDSGNFVTEPILHRGNVYFAFSGALYTAPIGGDVADAVCIYGEQQEDDGTNIVNMHELYYELWADGNDIYFMVKNYVQEDGTYKDTLFCYNPQTCETTQVWQVPDKSEVGEWDTTGVSVQQWYVSDGYICFYLSGNDIWRTELSTGKLSRLAEVKASAGAAAFSGEYIAVVRKEISGYDLLGGGSSLSGGDTLYVYDYGGSLAKEISLADIYKECDNASECSLLWISDGKIYIHVDATITGVNDEMTTGKHYIYRADIETGALEKTLWSIGE